MKLHYFVCGYPEKTVLPSEWHFCWKLFDDIHEGLFWGSLLFHWSIYALLMPGPWCFNYCSFVEWLETRYCEPIFLLLQSVLAIWDSFRLHRILLFYFCRNPVEILTGITLDLNIGLLIYHINYWHASNIKPSSALKWDVFPFIYLLLFPE